MGSSVFIARSRTVVARDEFGRFAAECNAATRDGIEDIVKDGAAASRRYAPVGTKVDTRPGHIPLKRSIRYEARGLRGEWYSVSKHALPQELGAAPHLIVGKVRFFWTKANEWFVWNHPRFGPVGSGKRYENWTPGGGVTINHPGNPAQPFLEPAYEEVALHGGSIRRIKAAYRRHGLI